MRYSIHRKLFFILNIFSCILPTLGYAKAKQQTITDAVIDMQAMHMAAYEHRKEHEIKQQRLQKERLQRKPKALQVNGDGAQCCCSCIVIQPSDFGQNFDTTYVITSPGKYVLQEDVTFFPDNEFTPAINILSDDVTLDLCAHTLSQGNLTENCYGIQIGEGYFYNDPDNVLKNISIVNGNITNFSAIGVFCYNASFDGPTAEAAFQDIRLQELNILECGSSPSFDFGSGIDFDSAASQNLYILDIPVAYKNITIENCHVNGCLGNAAIQIFTGDGVVVQDTTANDLDNPIASFFTFSHIVISRNVQIRNCQGNRARQEDPVATRQCGGLLCQRCVNIYVENSQFNDAFGEASVIVNTNASNCINAFFENCQFNNTRGGSRAGLIAGIHMSDGPGQQTQAEAMKFVNCQFNKTTSAQNNNVRNFSCGFFAITLKDMLFEQCEAIGIRGENPTRQAAGFVIATYSEDPAYPFGNVHDITFRHCFVGDLRADTECFGIVVPTYDVNRVGIQGAHTNMVVENCIVEKLFSKSNTHRVAAIAECPLDTPFLDDIRSQPPLMKNLFVTGCKVSDVRSNETANPSPLSCGILVESVLNPVICDNKINDCDRGILFTGTKKIVPNGFQLATSCRNATAIPPVFIDIDASALPTQQQAFLNKTRKNKVIVSVPNNVNSTLDFIFPTANLTDLHWKSGDEIIYDNKGGTNISGLISGKKYFLIVYRPGFSENGLVQNNSVSNCSISGFQDDRCPTESAWVNNTALLNGKKPSHSENYAIRWPNEKPQVDEGTLGVYPICPNKYFNLSLIKAQKKCGSDKHDKKKCDKKKCDKLESDVHAHKKCHAA